MTDIQVLDPQTQAAEETDKLFGIADLAQEFGISTRAIRFYEAKGLLKPARVNGARIYTKRERVRLRLILRAKSIGSSLTEIKHYLDLYGVKGEGRHQQLAYVVDRTGALIAELEQKQRHILMTLDELREIHLSAKAALAKKNPCGAD